MQRQVIDARKEGPFVLAVDFDNVIHDQPEWSMEINGKPMFGCRENLQRLRDQGVRIIIHSARASAKWVKIKNDLIFQNGQLEPMALWLKRHEIPYDEIWFSPGKPLAHAYLDDKGIEFVNWTNAGLCIDEMIQARKDEK